MTSFWQYGVARPFPPGTGFGQFTPTHLIVLALLALTGVILDRWYRHSGPAQRATMRHTIAWCIVGLEGGKDLVLIATHQWVWTSLPLNLCSWAMVFVVWDALHPNNLTREVLYALCLPGAVAALVTPDWASSPIVNIFVWQSFLIHTAIVVYVVARLITSEIVPQVKCLWLPALFLAIVVPPTYFINGPLGANYFFLATPAPGSPLVPIHDVFGSAYLVGMALLVAIIWVLLYTPWQIVRLVQASTK